MRLVIRVVWTTLFARPTLSFLTISLLACATTFLYGLYASVEVVDSLRNAFIQELAVEIELSDYSDSTRQVYEHELKLRPDVLTVQTLSAREVLDEVERELGESLRDVLTENPFPPIFRVRLRNPSPDALQSFAEEVSGWPGVLQVIYPRSLWEKFDSLLAALRGKFAVTAGTFALACWVLAGLSLRAIFRFRSPVWQLLLLYGLELRSLFIMRIVLAAFIGLCGGLMSVAVLYFGRRLTEWLLLTQVTLPSNWVLGCILGAILLALTAGVWVPRLARYS